MSFFTIYIYIYTIVLQRHVFLTTAMWSPQLLQRHVTFLLAATAPLAS